MLRKIFFTLLLIFSNLQGAIDINFEEDREVVPLKQIISLEVGAGAITRLKADTISGESSIKRDLYFSGIKLGAEDIGLRLFLSYRPALIDNYFTHSFGVELDSVIPITESESVKFFYGLMAGLVLYEIVDKNQTSGYDNATSPYYGIETGFTFEITPKIEIELGGRFTLTNINDNSTDKSYVFDQFFASYLAFNYKY
jgi:hypothetical protein